MRTRGRTTNPRNLASRWRGSGMLLWQAQALKVVLQPNNIRLDELGHGHLPDRLIRLGFERVDQYSDVLQHLCCVSVGLAHCGVSVRHGDHSPADVRLMESHALLYRQHW